jgi:teichuronic acid biosynthesis glycosyltransferase TuaC
VKILVVCSKNSGRISPFVSDQVNALVHEGIICEYHTIEEKGWRGYLKSRKIFIRKINSFKPDLIHAHFGLSGFLANLQFKIPVVTTFHGCDINKLSLRLLSYYPLLLSKFCIFVSASQVAKVSLFKYKSQVVPCGIDFGTFYPIDKKLTRNKLNWDQNKKLVLFSSKFDRPEKNATLAFEAMKLLPAEYELVELYGYSREEVNLVMNAVDVGLLTSIREGSPMFFKELMACGKPIVTTNVGDAVEQLSDTIGSSIVAYEAIAISEAIKQAIEIQKVTYSPEKLKAVDNKFIASKLISIYKKLLKVE